MALISTITENAFAQRRRSDWEDLDVLTHRVATRGVKKLTPEDVTRLSPLYRDVCADLSRAQAARYSAPLVDYLQGLTAAAHGVLYGTPSHAVQKRLANYGIHGGLLTAFPRAVRRNWKAMALAGALFFIPLLAGLAASLADPSFAFKLMPEARLRQLTDSYAKGFDDGRSSGDGAMMAGFYVHNNVGIALRCFALGIFGGIGSAFYMVHNGLSIGAVLGYVSSQGAGGNITTFIVGHGSLELGAIVLAGGAGLVLGWSMVAPGERTRLASLQAHAADVVVIVSGAAVMLLLAAGIEAFWSGSSVPSVVKRTVGAVLFVLVTLYLVFAGRGEEEAR